DDHRVGDNAPSVVNLTQNKNNRYVATELEQHLVLRYVNSRGQSWGCLPLPDKGPAQYWICERAICHGRCINPYYYINDGRINSVVCMHYDDLERLIVIDPLNGGEVNQPGDSGSRWLDRSTGQTVGLHFAGSNMP